MDIRFFVLKHFDLPRFKFYSDMHFQFLIFPPEKFVKGFHENIFLSEPLI